MAQPRERTGDEQQPRHATHGARRGLRLQPRAHLADLLLVHHQVLRAHRRMLLHPQLPAFAEVANVARQRVKWHTNSIPLECLPQSAKVSAREQPGATSSTPHLCRRHVRRRVPRAQAQRGQEGRGRPLRATGMPAEAAARACAGRKAGSSAAACCACRPLQAATGRAAAALSAPAQPARAPAQLDLRHCTRTRWCCLVGPELCNTPCSSGCASQGATGLYIGAAFVPWLRCGVLVIGA